MLEWIAIIVGLVVLHRKASRLDAVERETQTLRETVLRLRAELSALGRSAGEAGTEQRSPLRPDLPAREATPPQRATTAVPPHFEALAKPAPVAVPPAAPPAPEVAARPVDWPVPPVRPPAGPPAPPSRPATPPAPPKPPFDWEKLIGVKLFSWIAGAALAIAGVLFLR